MRRSGPLLCAIACSLTAATASATGAIPRAKRILFEPGNPSHVLLQADTWGMFESRDAGQSWSFICADASAGDALATQRSDALLAPGGAILVARGFDGLQRSEPDSACGFASASAFGDDEVVTDVTRNGADTFVLTATGTSGGVVTRVWRSADLGDTWSRVGSVVGGSDAGASFSGASLAIAPSAPQRMYVAGKYIGDAGTGFVQRSDDGGETWYASAPVPVPGPADGWTARLHGVHPTDPDRIFFWVDHIEGSGTAEPDALWASSDGGGSWTQVHVAAGDLPGFALSPDARTLAISGPSDGLLIADLDELAASGAAGLSQVFDGRVYGLSWTDEGLYAGHDDFAATEPRFMVGVSRDGGHTFEPFMSICDAPPIACPPESSTATACAPLVEPTAVNPSGRYVSDFLEGPRCTESTGTVVDADAGGAVASSPAADAAAPQAPVATHGVEPGEQGGCGCSVPGRAAGRGSFGVWLMALAVAWRRSRSRR